VWQRRARSGKRNSHGIASIRRESYNSVNGFTQKDGWWVLRAKVMERDQGRCRLIVNGRVCNRTATEVHHITPLSRGGTSSMANCIAICKTCHDKRHNHLYRSRS
jgi:5-methylcytosine-specific restriction endonuclease McrA